MHARGVRNKHLLHCCQTTCEENFYRIDYECRHVVLSAAANLLVNSSDGTDMKCNVYCVVVC